MSGRAVPLAARLATHVLRSWYAPRPDALARALSPLAAIYSLLQRADRRRRERQRSRCAQPGAPVVVVGNLVAGGAGKTPTTIALIHALQAAGRRPGVVSRGHGRQATKLAEVDAAADAATVGDEPLLIRRRTGVPVVVAADRVAAARELLRRHPAVDVVVADDGLQHRQLRRDVEVLVIDERGFGNGLLLPAGPLREPSGPGPGPDRLVLYPHGQPSTPWPGHLAQRRLRGAWPLAAWLAGASAGMQPLSTLRGRPLLAMAGIAVPERFFSALEAEGLTIARWPLADHQAYGADPRRPPWPAGTRELITTEKDAVKLAPWVGGDVAVWVVGLDLQLPADFVAALLARLPPPAPAP
jgi:tetraacyldisaccharide 4'-kinase